MATSPFSEISSTNPETQGLPPLNGSLAPSPLKPSRWQRELATAIRDPSILLQALNLPIDLLPAARLASESFPLLVTQSFLSRILPGDPQDPLLLQILPALEETTRPPELRFDAVGDLLSQKHAGLIQKYHGRALLITTGSCAINCRYCFRRHFPYHNSPKSWAQWEPAFQQIREDESLTEIILSGGDPLMLPDARFHELVQKIAQIPHVKRLRIHSRLPIVLPSRVNHSLLNSLTNSRLQPYMIVHCNHPQELDATCSNALSTLVRAGIPTLNQAVLLKGVNDSFQTLLKLCQQLINLGVLPYYLHQLDRVDQVSHFEVDPAHGQQLIEQLRVELPGYAVPQFVQEIPGQPHKTPL